MATKQLIFKSKDQVICSLMNSIVKNWQENKQEKEREYRTKTSINKNQRRIQAFQIKIPSKYQNSNQKMLNKKNI